MLRGAQRLAAAVAVGARGGCSSNGVSSMARVAGTRSMLPLIQSRATSIQDEGKKAHACPVVLLLLLVRVEPTIHGDNHGCLRRATPRQVNPAPRACLDLSSAQACSLLVREPSASRAFHQLQGPLHRHQAFVGSRESAQQESGDAHPLGSPV